MDLSPHHAELTQHAQIRLQQRGIPRWYLEALIACGRRKHARNGADLYCIDKPARQRLERELPRTRYAQAERYFNVYAVVAPEGGVITVARRSRHAN